MDDHRHPTSKPSWGIDFVHPDGTLEPVGRYLHFQMPDANGGQVAAWLVAHGLPEQPYAVWYGKQRDLLRADEERNADRPGLVKLAEEEKQHYERKDEFSKAFVAAQKRKSK